MSVASLVENLTLVKTAKKQVFLIYNVSNANRQHHYNFFDITAQLFILGCGCCAAIALPMGARNIRTSTASQTVAKTAIIHQPTHS